MIVPSAQILLPRRIFFTYWCVAIVCGPIIATPAVVPTGISFTITARMRITITITANYLGNILLTISGIIAAIIAVIAMVIIIVITFVVVVVIMMIIIVIVIAIIVIVDVAIVVIVIIIRRSSARICVLTTIPSKLIGLRNWRYC